VAEFLRINVLPVDQPLGRFYAGVVSAKSIVRICKFDFRRIVDRGGYKDFLGIQRPLKDKRIKEISKYINTVDACFPTSVVISIDPRCAKIVDSGQGLLIELSEHNDVETGLIIPFGDIATIIDGQHRLKPFDDESVSDMDLVVTMFIAIDDATEAQLFSKVNLAQTKVNRSLAYDLFSLEKSDSPEKLAHEIVVALDSMDESPFKGRIKRLGVATEGRFGETLSQSTMVQGILPYLTKDPIKDRDNAKRYGFFPDLSQKDANKLFLRQFMKDKEDEKILAILINYFGAIAERWPEAWYSTGRGKILSRTNGFIAFMRFFRHLFGHISQSPRVVKQSEFFAHFSKIDWEDDYFNTENFKPGSSGSSQLYRDLMDTLP